MSVVECLKNTSKGRLTYDRNWSKRDIQLNIEPGLSVDVNIDSLIVNKRESDETKVKVKKDENSDEAKSTAPTALPLEANESKYDYDLLEYEKETNAIFRQKFDFRVECFEEFEKESSEELEEEMRLIRQRCLLNELKRIKQYNEEFSALRDEVRRKELEIRSKADPAEYKLKEIETKHRKSVEDKERKVNEERCKVVTSIKAEVESMIRELNEFIDRNATIINDLRLSHTIKQHQHNALMALNSIDMIFTKHKISQEDVLLSEKLKNEIRLIIDSSFQQFENFRLQKAAVTQNESEKVAESTDQVKFIDHKPVEEPTSAPVKHELHNHVDARAFKSYVSLQAFYCEIENSLQTFMSEKKLKHYKTDLQLFIRTNVNAISNGSMDHLRERLKKLTHLFEGKAIDFQDKQISSSRHPDGLNFCMYSTAKTFISVATKQVISVPKAAFPLAFVIVSLWSKFPMFGKLFLAFLQQKCPYVVPYYPRREPDEEETHHLIACGYDYSADGTTLESEESFLNRMRALVRLYGAIVQTNNSSHGIQNGWTYIARTLNLEPRPAITPAIIHAFLSSTAYKMLVVYKKQFFKILKFLVDDYIPMIERCASKEVKKQSIVQLKLLMEGYNKQIARRSSLLEPDGVVKIDTTERMYFKH